MASKTTGLGDKKPAKKPRRRIPLSSVRPKEADKLRKESKIPPPSPTKPKPKPKSPEPKRPPSKPRRNSNVQDIVDGLPQILDAYDDSMGGPQAKKIVFIMLKQQISQVEQMHNVKLRGKLMIYLSVIKHMIKKKTKMMNYLPGLMLDKN